MNALTLTAILTAALSGAAVRVEPARVSEAPAPPRHAPAPEAGVGSEEAWVGIVFGDALDGGVQVVAVVPGGPADEGGVREGDVILAVGERATPDRRALQGVVQDLRPGEEVTVRLIRGGRIARTSLRPIDARRREYPLLGLRLPEVGRFSLRPGPERAPFAGCETTRIPRELRVHFGAPEEAGVLVVGVDAEGPAATAGIRVGDVIVRAAGRPMEEPPELGRALTAGVGNSIAVEVVRRRKTVTLRIEPAGPVPAIGDSERRRLESEAQRLRRELDRVEAEIEQLRKLER